MVDFKNASFLKLKPVPDKNFFHLIEGMLVPGETVIQSFQSIRDGVVFTSKRIFAINVQGITGKKKDFSSLPYSRIQAFSVETAGLLDLDSELELKFEFTSNCNVSEICKMIGDRVL